MFDASEILFLDVAVRVGVLTHGQRERLIDYAREDGADTNVTDLVVDAGLMIEGEVKQVMKAIAGDVGGEALAESRAAYGSWDDAASPVSAGDLDSILRGIPVSSSGPGDAFEALESRARHTGRVAKAAALAEQEEEWEYEDDDTHAPAFPMPGQGTTGAGTASESASNDEAESAEYQTNAHWYASTPSEINEILHSTLQPAEDD